MKEAFKVHSSKLPSKNLVARLLVNYFLILLLFLMTLIIFIVVSKTFYSLKLDNNVLEEAESLSQNFAHEKDSPQLPQNSMVVYYNSEGEILPHLGFHRYDDFPMIKELGEITDFPYQVMHDGAYYKTVVREMLYKDITGIAYVKVLKNVELFDVILVQFDTALGIFMIVVSVLIACFSYMLTMLQLKPYRKAVVNSNTFTSNVSHELGTPLAIIKANLQTVMHSPNETVNQVSNNIAVSLNEIVRLEKLTRQLLTLSRFQANRLIADKKPVNLKHKMELLLEPYATIAESQDKTLILKIDKSVDTELMVDGDLITQSLIALLDNAVKYTKSGIVIVIKAYVNTHMSKSKLVLIVEDNGEGVGAHEINKIFTRFYRGDKSRASLGTGLGLPIVRANVLAMSGTVVAQNLSPKGFAVIVKIPI